MRRYFPDLQAFTEAARGADVVPVYRQLLGDHLTPVSAFRGAGPRSACVSAGKRRRRGEDRALQLHRDRAFAGLPGQRGQRGHPAGRPRCGASAEEFKTTDPLARPRKSCSRRGRYHHDPNLPAFTGGLVGYAGYDTIRYYEGEKLPSPPKDDRRSAGSALRPVRRAGRFSITWTRRSRSSPTRIVHGDIADRSEVGAYRDRLPAAMRSMLSCDVAAAAAADCASWARSIPQPPLDAEVRKQHDPRAVRGRRSQRARNTSRPATSFSSCPASGCACRATADPFDIYRALRVINPSPFMFYPEEPRLHADRLEPGDPVPRRGRQGDDPPAGRHAPPRRNAEEEDTALADELLADPKERAEHIMLVDLGRNDVGRVAKIGSGARSTT